MELSHLQALKTENPDLKLLVSMGGYTVGSEIYSAVAADPALRANLIESVLDFLETNKFDGLDLDWEYPGVQNGSDPINDPVKIF